MEVIRAQKLALIGRQMLYEDTRTKAVTELVTFERTDPVERFSFRDAAGRHEAAFGMFIHEETREPVFVHRAAAEYNDDDEMIPRVRLSGPVESRYLYRRVF